MAAVHEQEPTVPDSGVAAATQWVRPSIRQSPMPGYEHVRGFGIYGLPLDSGHVLALRVFPENDFAPYRTVWHRTPDGEWTIYVDGPRQDVACPRYYGAAADLVVDAEIALTWLGPNELQVRMPDHEFELTVDMVTPWRARLLGAVGARLPIWLWRVPGVPPRLARIADAVLDVGDVRLAGTVPNGQRTFLMPRRLFPIVSGTATLAGENLGTPVRTETNPTIGDVTLPARPMLAVGEAYFSITDRDEYEQTRAEIAESISA